MTPSAPPWGHVPCAVRRLFDFQTRADIRVRVRSIVIRIRIRHTAIRIRIVVPAIDHTAYWETPPFAKVLTFYLIYKITSHKAAERQPPKTVNNQSTQSQRQPCSTSFNSRQEAATTAEYMAQKTDKPQIPTTTPPNRCFHLLLRFKNSKILLLITVLFIKLFSTGLRRFRIWREESPPCRFTLTFCRFAPALARCAYATSTIALNADTLVARTSLPRKARREPTNVNVLEAS